jgi:hypothetical protein
LKILFRLFLAGIVTSGAGAYAWLFGAGGDPMKALESVGEALEVKEVLNSLSTSVKEPSMEKESPTETDNEISVGVPPF